MANFFNIFNKTRITDFWSILTSYIFNLCILLFNKVNLVSYLRPHEPRERRKAAQGGQFSTPEGPRGSF